MLLTGGRLRARIAETGQDVAACQRLRYHTFYTARGVDRGASQCLDVDEFDAHCRHMMVEDSRSGDLVCCFRMMPLNNGSEISRSYSAQYYNLAALADYPGKMVEMGRFCVHPDCKDPAVIRTAWSAMTKFVDDEKVELLFGCSSFYGVDADDYMDAFALLKERHIAPKRWLPRVKAPKVFRFASRLKLRRPNMKLALRRMPPLLRTYLVMGGWVSDHAVIDNELNTLHVFTGVEISQVPETRARLLRGN
ncbi:MAG: GNAT family N-acyltransferase [Pseudomonadota bacterium]